MNKSYWFSLFLLLLTLKPAVAQDSLARQYNLPEIVDIALGRSPDALLAETRKENRYWEWRDFRADYMPNVFLSGTLPDFNRANEPITQEDGTIEFRPVRQNLARVNLFARQVIGYTGTEIFLNSNAQRFDDYERDVTRYTGEPARIGINQQIFQYNPFKWNNLIEPLRYEESRKVYSEDLEQIAIDATDLYFDVLLAQVTLELAQTNLANNDTIFQIAQGRFNLGKIGENLLLQSELNVMEARQQFAQAELDLETSSLSLKTFIGLNDKQDVVLTLPNDIPVFTVDSEVAIQEALNNRSDAVAYVRRLKEAESRVALAKGESGLSVDISASYGLTQRSDEFIDLYNDPENQQRLQVEFSIPILDWGRTKSQVKQAQASYKLAQYTVEQEKINFEQEVYTQVRTFDMLRNQVEIAETADDIANRSYEIAKQRYLIGKVDITDLNQALEKKDNARQQYIQSLSDFWAAYYTLRQLTLYDFARNEPLYVEEGESGMQ
ncbi:TolC family protein [Tunicatimonas pelagia]|uniref:TolC family protein n=1 Tax=Tunicatimonas pelagia TaxID=931531 RepID=UPI002665D688|nr:TolC family protein [Tunicatimonas pelagia]WKN46015.1 TolC family protein [Tunicatimonas pelagia]